MALTTQFLGEVCLVSRIKTVRKRIAKLSTLKSSNTLKFGRYGVLSSATPTFLKAMTSSKRPAKKTARRSVNKFVIPILA